MRKNALLAALISLALCDPVVAQETTGVGSGGGVPAGGATAANQTSVQGTTGAGTAPANMIVGGAIYNSAAPTPANGQSLALQLDSAGNLLADLKTSLPAGQAGIGNVGGKTVTICTTPTVTTGNAYGTNFVVGGLLHFVGLFTSTGSGILQGVIVTMKDAESNGFTFIPFNANPSSTTWTDAAVAALNAADVTKVRAPVPLASNVQLAATLFSEQYAYGLGLPIAPGTTDMYGVLLANAALTNNFAGASDVQVCVTTLDDE